MCAAPLDRGVAVVDRGPQPAQPEAGEPASLILRERLRRIEEDRAGGRLARDGVEHGERERERLAGRRPGRDDDALPAGDGLPGLGLVRVEPGQPREASRSATAGWSSAGSGSLRAPRAGWVTAVGDLAGLEHGIPGRGVAQRRVPSRPPRRSACAAARRGSSRPALRRRRGSRSGAKGRRSGTARRRSRPRRADELQPAFVVARELLEDRLDRAARPAPRGREVDEHGNLGFEHVPGEARVGRVDRHSRPRSAFQRSTGTWCIASTTIAPLIFDSPTRRSTNVIGTSTTRKPERRARYVPSIWNP